MNNFFVSVKTISQSLKGLLVTNNNNYGHEIHEFGLMKSIFFLNNRREEFIYKWGYLKDPAKLLNINLVPKLNYLSTKLNCLSSSLSSNSGSSLNSSSGSSLNSSSGRTASAALSNVDPISSGGRSASFHLRLDVFKYPGLTVSFLENLIIIISFIRFTFYAIRYNVRTSLILTCISFFVTVLWYSHFGLVFAVYEDFITGKTSPLPNLKPDAYTVALEPILNTGNTRERKTEDLAYLMPWYRPLCIFYISLTRGLVYKKNYIDPISMIISLITAKLPESPKFKILLAYYTFCMQFIPACIKGIARFWGKYGDFMLYAFITKILYRFCPYSIKWHWSCLMLVKQIDPVIFRFFERAFAYRYKTLPSQITKGVKGVDFDISVQIKIATGILCTIIWFHLGLIIYSLIHGLLGQYYYLPFLTESTEMLAGYHRRKNTYSVGYTPWQKRKRKSKSKKVFYFIVVKNIIIFGLMAFLFKTFTEGLII